MARAEMTTPCLTPKSTADVVQIVRFIAERLGASGIVIANGQSRIEFVCETLQAAISAASGTSVLMIGALRCVGEDHDQLWTGFHGGEPPDNFTSITAAQNRASRIIGCVFEGSDAVMPDMERLHYFACLVVTGETGKAGQVSHPANLADQLDSVAQTWREARLPESLSSDFLLVLETACVRAQRSGLGWAGVAILDSVSDAELVPVRGSRRDDCDVAAERAHRGSRCVTIAVVQQEGVG